MALASWAAAAVTPLFPHGLSNRPGLAAFKKGRNCETNPILFKTHYLPNTNNEKISLLTESKSYDV
jgi:hypothetical protein